MEPTIQFQPSYMLGWHEVLLVALSLFVSLSVVVVGRKTTWLSRRRHDLHAVQAMHTRPTPRLGGVAIFASLALSIVFAPIELSVAYAEFLFATSLLFIAGLAEDLGFNVNPLRRLMAAVAASALCVVLLGVWLPRIGIPPLEPWIATWWVGVPVTLLVTAGVSNGFNLIDGVNGLASLTAIAALLALGQIAHAGSYAEMLHLSNMVAASILGFLLLNFPKGLIFLGDAGAYVLGFVISWFGIAVLHNVPSASAWAILLTMFWPVADTLLAIFRRIRRRRGVASPDRLHVHQMMMRTLEICVLGRKRRHIANPLTTLILSPFVCAPPLVGVLLWNQNALAFIAFVAFSILFVGTYMVAPSVVSRFRRSC